MFGGRLVNINWKRSGRSEVPPRQLTSLSRLLKAEGDPLTFRMKREPMRKLLLLFLLGLLAFGTSYFVTRKITRPGPVAPISDGKTEDSDRSGSRPESESFSGPAGSQDPPAGMVWIPGGEFWMGTDSQEAWEDERPAHRVQVDGFWMDATEVTNAEFRRFVEATGFVTTAERAPTLEEIMAQSPRGPRRRLKRV